MKRKCALPVLDERAFLVLAEGGADLLFGVHHDRSVPGDRLAQRLAGDEQEASSVRSGGGLHFVTITEYDETVVAKERIAIQVKVIITNRVIIEGILFAAETRAALEDIGKAGVTACHRAVEADPRGDGHIEVLGFDDDIFYRIADHLDDHAVLKGDHRDFGGFDIAVTRVHHLLRAGQVGPELKSVHAAVRRGFGHLLVDDAAARGHPLHIAGADRPFVAHAVTVFHGAGCQVGDGLDAAVRMPGEAFDVIFGSVAAEIVKQQKGVKQFGGAEAEGTAQVNAGTLEGRLAFGHTDDLSGGHIKFLFEKLKIRYY